MIRGLNQMSTSLHVGKWWSLMVKQVRRGAYHQVIIIFTHSITNSKIIIDWDGVHSKHITCGVEILGNNACWISCFFLVWWDAWNTWDLLNLSHACAIWVCCDLFKHVRCCSEGLMLCVSAGIWVLVSFFLLWNSLL